jgi:hypothetical protein
MRSCINKACVPAVELSQDRHCSGPNSLLESDNRQNALPEGREADAAKKIVRHAIASGRLGTLTSMHLPRGSMLYSRFDREPQE